MAFTSQTPTREEFISWLDKEIELEGSDHARNAGSAWKATVFSISGLLLIGHNIPACAPRAPMVACLAALSVAALLFVNMQFELRWLCAENSGRLRYFRAKALANEIEVGYGGWSVAEFEAHPTFVRQNMPQMSLLRRARWKSLLIVALLWWLPPSWDRLERRARSEFACYLGILGSWMLATWSALH